MKRRRRVDPQRWQAWLLAWDRLGFALALEITSREYAAGRNW